MKIFSFIFTFVFISTISLAQTTLKGKVFDANTKAPLGGATIAVEGKTVTAADKDGLFSINCTQVKNITVSFVGYTSSTVNLKNCTDELSIALTASSNTLTDVEITATSNQNKSLLYQPVSITKLGETELSRSNGLFLDDAINGNVPGVSMQRRAVSSGQQFNIRGYGNGTRGTRGVSSNFDGQGYKVYLNGIPVTDAEGITTLDDIDFGSVGNVEVTKGPSGSLYGLTIAGAVNLRTVKPEKGKTTIGQDVLLGNYGLQRYTSHFSTSGDHSSILLNYGSQKSDGFTIHNASKKDFVNFIGEFQPNAKEAITTYFGYSKSYDERSGELTITQYETKDYTGNIEYIKRNGHSEVFTVRAGVAHTYNFNNNISNTTTIFGTAFNSNVSSAGGWTDKSATNFGIRSTFDTKFSLKNGITLSGITGIEAQRQNAQTIGYGMGKDPNDPNAVWVYGNPLYWIINAATSNVYTTTSTASLFTEWTLTLPQDVSITAGIGYSNMKIGLDDRFYNAATPNRTRGYDTSYKNMVSPHIAINKVFSKQFSVYASYSKGYKAPVSSYFYIPYATGFAESGVVNKNLKPEVGNQFEIGTKGSSSNGKLTYQLALFDAIFSDKMTTVAVPYNSTTTLYSYVANGGKQDNKGVEALVKYAVYQSTKGLIKHITPYVNCTYSDFKYKDYKFQSFAGTTVTTVDYSNQAVAGIAKFVGNIGVDAATNCGFYGNINLFYKDGMPITSDGTFRATSYSLLNAKLGYQHTVSKHFDVDVNFGINNINNTQYPIMVFVNQLPDAYMAAPLKANYFGGLSVKYIF
jgi:iron complex outermembrane receptor protein